MKQHREPRGGVADMVACGRLRSADIITLDTVALFGLSEVPGDQPPGTQYDSLISPRGNMLIRSEEDAQPARLTSQQSISLLR